MSLKFEIMRTLLAILVATSSVSPTVRAQQPIATIQPTSQSTLLQQLDSEVRQTYCRTVEGIVRVYLPAKAINPATDVLRKWEKRLNPDLRQRLNEDQASATGATTAPTTDSGDATTRPTVTPTSVAGEVVTIGIAVNDGSELVVPAYLDRAQLPDPLRIVTKDGVTATATIVAADKHTAITLLRVDRPIAKPLTIAPHRPVEGALLIALCGDDTRLIVWTGTSRDSAVVVTPDGAVGVLRWGRFLGGPGYATLIENLRTDGRAQRSQLGMTIGELPTPQQGHLATMKIIDRPGLEVLTIEPESPAATAGVQPGDLLLTIAGQRVPDITSMAALLTDVRGPTTLVLGRGTERIEVTVDAQLPKPK